MASCVVVLAHRHDVGAHAVARVLRRWSPLEPVVVSPEHLSVARWSHRIGRRGDAHTTLTLADGRVIAGSDIACLLNRIDYLPVARFDRASERDRDYAAMEFQALVASWLGGLGDRVVNRPTATGADAGPTSTRQWLAVAARRGMPTAPAACATAASVLPAIAAGAGPLRPLGPWVPARSPTTGRVPVELGPPTVVDGETTTIGVLVADGRAVGPLAAELGPACAEIAAEAGCRLIGFGFDRTADGPALREVFTRPALSEPWQVAVAAEMVADVAHRAAS